MIWRLLYSKHLVNQLIFFVSFSAQRSNSAERFMKCITIPFIASHWTLCGIHEIQVEKKEIKYYYCNDCNAVHDAFTWDWVNYLTICLNLAKSWPFKWLNMCKAKFILKFGHFSFAQCSCGLLSMAISGFSVAVALFLKKRVFAQARTVTVVTFVITNYLDAILII